MSKILPPTRPHRDKSRIAKVLTHFKLRLETPSLVFIRGHYLNSMGKANANDLNIYDDSVYLVSENFRIFESFNANTDPAFVRRGNRALAMLNLGKYRFYQGKHRQQYNALRAFPEGVVLPCTRDGQPSTCQYINIHRGSSNAKALDVTNSEGCLTIPSIQWTEFITRVYDAMNRQRAKTIDVALLENRGTPQRWFDQNGVMVA
jgi:hypothetical protein